MKNRKIREPLLLLLLLLLAAFVRIRFFVGFGLGDDPGQAYRCCEFMEKGFGAFPPFCFNYRLGLFIPTAAAFRMLGVNDAAFVLFPLASSVLLVAVVYLIGRELAGREAAFFAGLVQALSPFDVVFASTFTIDIPASFLLALSFLLFLKAEGRRGAGNLLLNFLSAFCVFWAYFIKLPALFMPVVFAVLSILRWKRFRRHVSFYGCFAALMAAAVLFGYLYTGDPLNFIHRETAYGPSPGPFRDLWVLYPQWMFTRYNWLNAFLFGFHFHLAAIAAAGCLFWKKLRSRSAPILIWGGVLFLLLEFFPVELRPLYKIPPRFFRYAYAFVAQASLLAGLFLAAVWCFKGGLVSGLTPRVRGRTIEALSPLRLLVLLALGGYACASLAQGWRTGRLYRDYYSGPKLAARMLASLPEKPIYCDNGLHDYFNFYTRYGRMDQAKWNLDGLYIQTEIVGKRNLEPLWKIGAGYVVFGGSRGVDYSPFWILRRENAKIPDHWRRVWELPRPADGYRPEPLRIYEVDPSRRRPAKEAPSGLTPRSQAP